MDHRSYMIILYDYYKELLTTKQQQYFEGYYFENESLQELSEIIGVETESKLSKSGVYHRMKKITEIAERIK